MKHLLVVLALISFSLAAATAVIQPRAQASSATSDMVRTPVVVELFTSEGCSSCPPADALLARLSEGQVAGNIHLIALEEHVDYWNDLGWTDPFSSQDWTSRQYVYARTLGNGNAYTPPTLVARTLEFAATPTHPPHET